MISINQKEVFFKVEEFLIGLFNQVAAIYQNEGVLVCLSEVYVWNTVDPYVATTTEGLLTEFQNRKASINGDLGQLLTYRSINGGRAAGFNGLHSSNVDDKLSVTELNPWYYTYPTYSWSVFAMAHEFGHLFGSRHTHACVWNGNNTAIDGCWAVEGSCAAPGIPANGGTIMSYCHQQDVKINFNFGFGSQPGNVIRNSVATATNLKTVAISGDNLITTTGKTFALNNATALRWSSSPNIQLVSSNSQNATFKSIGDGLGWIKVATNIGVVGPTITHEVWSGKPVIASIDGPNRTPNGQYATFRAVYDYKCSPTSFEWILNPVNGNSVYGANSSVLDVAFYNAGSYQLVVRAANECGMGEYKTSGVNVYNANGRSYIAYPNPANQSLYVDFSSIGQGNTSALNITKEIKSYDVRLFNLQGVLKLTIRSTGERVSLDVSNLPNGNYFLHIYDKKEKDPVVQQIIIQH